MPDHQEVYLQTRKIALELSSIYASQKKAQGASLTDLFLAAQLAKTGDKCALLTGNRKDFPSIMFDVVSIFNIETNEDGIKSFSLLKLNDTNYQKYKENLAKIDNKIREEMAS